MKRLAIYSDWIITHAICLVQICNAAMRLRIWLEPAWVGRRSWSADHLIKRPSFWEHFWCFIQVIVRAMSSATSYVDNLIEHLTHLARKIQRLNEMIYGGGGASVALFQVWRPFRLLPDHCYSTSKPFQLDLDAMQMRLDQLVKFK